MAPRNLPQATSSAADERPFLEAIRAEPDNDAPRLVFADWLEERGDPRAEFIRVQCQLDPLELDDPLRRPLEDREAALLEQHDSTWRRTLPKVAGIDLGARLEGWDNDWRHDPRACRGFRRGFLSAVTVGSYIAWARKLPDVMADPLIDELRVELPQGRQSQVLGAAPWLSRLTTLSCSGTGAPFDPLPLLQSNPWPRLRRLDLWTVEAVGEMVTSWPILSQLELLALDVSGLDPAQLAWLARPNRLRVLHLSDCTPEMVDALASSRSASQLREFRLWAVRGQSDASSLSVLTAAAKRFSHLTRLEYHALEISEDDVVGLTKLAAQGRLQKLELDSHIRGGSPKAYAALLASPKLASLDYLKLERQQVKKPGAVAIAGSPVLRGLRHLELNHCGLDDAAVTVLADSPNLSRLHTFSLFSNKISDKAALALAASPHLERVETLVLSGDDLSAKGKKALQARFGKRLQMFTI